MDANKSSDKLESKIANAFPSPFNLSHEACLGVRKQLFSAQGKDIPNLLGPVLIDLIFHHSRSSTDPVTAETVVSFLASANPPPLEILPGSQLDPSQILDFTATRLRESKVLFDKFSVEQASAIRDWLLAALSWNEPHLPENEITAALEYWRKAAAS